MTLKSKLLALARIIADEADRNAPFRKALQEILDQKKSPAPRANRKGSRHRRAPAKVDPIQLTREGQNVRDALGSLNIEELKDVVAEFGMDPSKLVMKWKDSGKIIEHIIETSNSRATKGEVFRQ